MRAMLLLQYDWNWAGAEQEFRRAIELDPHYAVGRSFWVAPRCDGTLRREHFRGQTTLDLDPLSTAVNADLDGIVFGPALP